MEVIRHVQIEVDGERGTLRDGQSDFWYRFLRNGNVVINFPVVVTEANMGWSIFSDGLIPASAESECETK